MQSILTSGMFWATNILYMNDSEEYVNGLQEICGILTRYRNLAFRDTEVVKKLIHVQDPHIFTISFCTNGDLLSQWCIYARESGVNLELDFNLLGVNEQSPGKFFCIRDGKDASQIEVTASLKPVIYFTRNAMLEKLSEQRVRKHAAEIVTRIKSLAIRDGEDGADAKISELAAQIKRYEFSAEQEWRLLFNMTEYAGEYNSSPFFYREQDSILKPFIKVIASKNDMEPSPIPWPITAVTVGPGYNQDQVFQSLRYFLNFGKYMRQDGIEFMASALELFLDKAEARCRPLVVNQSSLKETIERYKTKSKSNLLNANVMCERASDLKEILAQKFPQCAEVLKSIELTSGGIILQKSNIPYIY